MAIAEKFEIAAQRFAARTVRANFGPQGKTAHRDISAVIDFECWQSLENPPAWEVDPEREIWDDAFSVLENAESKGLGGHYGPMSVARDSWEWKHAEMVSDVRAAVERAFMP